MRRSDYHIAQDEVRIQHNITRSGAELLAAWAAFVHEVEDGYDWDISEYRNEIRVRDELSVLAVSDVLTPFVEHADFLEELRQLDERFRAQAHHTYRFPSASTWWRQLVPKSGGGDFARYCSTAHGFRLYSS